MWWRSERREPPKLILKDITDDKTSDVDEEKLKKFFEELKKPRKKKQKFDLAAYFAQIKKEEEEAARKFMQKSEGETTPSGPVVPKIFMAGGPGSGKGTQAAKIAEEFKCVHISIGDLVRNELKKDNEWTQKAKPIVDSGKYLPQTMINPLLKATLEEDDCKEFGWILDSYPRGKENQQYLASLGEEPNLIFFLDISLEDSIERQSGRVKDPVTGEIYHLKHKPPPTEEIKKRCEQRSTDNSEKAKIRYETYLKSGWHSAEHYAHYYPTISVHCLDATDPLDTIYADIKDEIEKLTL